MSGWKGMKRRKVEDEVDGGPDGMTCGRSGTGMNTVQVIVPANKTGLVIGKGGENIRQINLQSQAHVEIQRNPLPGSDPMYKTFIIRGTPDQIVLAQQLIQEKIGGDGTGGPSGMHMGRLGPEGPPSAPGGLGLPTPQGNFGRPTTSPKFHGPPHGPPQQAQPPQQFQAQQSCSEAPNQYQSPQPNAAQQNEPAPQDPSAASAGPSETRSASNVQNQNFGDVQTNQFNANVGTLMNLYGPAPSQTLSAEKKAELEKKFLNIFKQRALKVTEEKIIGPFEYLKKPDRQVNPSFMITRYYQGQTALTSDVYRPDTQYPKLRSYMGNSIQLEQFLDKVHYAALIGDAGSGKTTAAKRFTQHALKKEIESLKHIRLVHFVTLASIDGHEKRTLFDLIFAPFMSHQQTDELKTFGYEWVREHRNEILLVFDGLDQANWGMENNDSFPKIGYGDRAHAPVIFHNLLNKGLLENCKILLTSREHAIKDFTFNNRPAVTISLTGLTMDDRLYLIRELSGNFADTVLRHLQHILPGVLSVCENPLLLVFSVAVSLRDPTNAPDTFSGILLRVLAYFCLSENWRQVVDFPKIFKKLKNLAYNGTSKGRVLFSWDELEELGLEINVIKDIMAVTPASGTNLHFRLLEEGSFFIYFFCHQSIQEALTALHVAELPLEEFQSFVSAELLQPRMEVVRRFLFGILFSTSASSEDKLMTRDISDKSSKMEHLKNWLNKTYIPQEEDWERLCSLLCECGSMLGDVCNGHLPRLNCYEDTSGLRNHLALASVLRAVSNVDELVLMHTGLDITILSALAESVTKIKDLQIRHLVLPNEDDEPLCDLFVKIARRATYRGYAVAANRPKNIGRLLEVLEIKGFHFFPMRDPYGARMQDVETSFGLWLACVAVGVNPRCYWFHDLTDSNLSIKSTEEGQCVFRTSSESSQDSASESSQDSTSESSQDSASESSPDLTSESSQDSAPESSQDATP